MPLKPRHDLQQAGASIEEVRDDNHATDFTVVYPGSFKSLQANTQHLYQRIGDEIQAEEGQLFGVEVVKLR